MNSDGVTINAACLPFAELTSLVATRLLPPITTLHQYYWLNGGWLGDEFGLPHQRSALGGNLLRTP